MYSRRRTEDEWREVVADFDASGLTQELFARKKGLKVGTFRSWVYKIRGASKEPRFVELVKSTPGGETEHVSRTTLLVGEVRVEFAERPEVEYVVALLRGLGEATP
jgi:hypothetical protein